MRFSTSISALQISVWNWYCFKNFKLQISICSHHLSRKSEIFHFTWSHTTSRHYKFACIHTYILLHVHQYTIIHRIMYVYVIYKWLMPCCLACKTSLSLVYAHHFFLYPLMDILPLQSHQPLLTHSSSSFRWSSSLPAANAARMWMKCFTAWFVVVVSIYMYIKKFPHF